MPEYLAPGVYVEEVPSGNKPIEGVSTSTAGMVGVTQRGPVNDPTLVTSFADFTRQFGDYLDHHVFTQNRDQLPYAVEGFFINGGQRVYITRVVGANATFAEVDLYGIPIQNPASTTLAQRVAVGDDTLPLAGAVNINSGDTLLLQDGPRSEYIVVQSNPVTTGVRLYGQLAADHASGDNVTPQTVAEDTAFTPAGDLDAGATTVDLIDVTGLVAGQVLRLRDTADTTTTEYVTIAAVDAGANTVDLSGAGLQFDHPVASTQIQRVTLTPGAATTLTADAAVGDFVLALADASALAPDSVIAVGTELHVARTVVTGLSVVTSVVQFIHAAGVVVIKQTPLLRVHARHQGQWGNSLRITVRQSSILDTTVVADVAQNDTPLTLNATFGLSAGSVLNVTRTSGTPATTTQILRQRVAGVNPATNEVDLAGGAGVALQEDDSAVSLEFDLIIERLNEVGKVVESEAFTTLGMDPSHNRYARTIIGAFDRASDEPEQAGESNLIRLSDLTLQDNGTDLIDAATRRLSVPYDGVTRQLVGGSDDLTTIDDNTYIGAPAVDPEDRTGIFSLENIDDISIVAAPGRTSQNVQNALINHCTLMRYRFAVLDSPPNAKVKDVQTQRQLYDTTYGALYYPWLTIGDPFGRNGDVRYIASSGHVTGIYARSDVQRGVHKAPANEVVLGVRDLQVRLAKGEQDILNPKNVNCLRNFRDINRGLRVWGARTLSSDPEWKYVNVRRLFLFVEKSIERGTQFAVFEPNAEPLWATINRSVSNFLTAVWRSGALEGTKVEEAFFVKVDRTTMTQNDIDNGRLIILVGIAPVKPAEFVIFRISQKTREATG